MTTIPVPEPTAVDHEAAASQLVAEIRQLVQSRVPGFALAAKGRRRKINTTASLTDGFFDSTAAACAANSSLSLAGDVTPAELRDTVAFTRAYGTVSEELRIMSRGVDDTVAERRYDVGGRALRVYNAAERINRPDEREMLVPHLAAMKRTLNRGRKKAAAKAAVLARAAAKGVPPAAAPAAASTASAAAPDATSTVPTTPTPKPTP